VAKISIASRRKMHNTFPKSSVSRIAMIPQNLQMETDVKFDLTKEEIVKFFSNLNRALSKQEQTQFTVTLTRTDANKIKIDVKSQPNGDGKKILTSDEVCNMLKITKRVLHKHARIGIIPGLKIGRKWRFEADRIFKLFREI